MKRAILADCPSGAIVRVRGRWGVVTRNGVNRRKHRRVVDFWDGGRERVAVTEPVDVLP